MFRTRRGLLVVVASFCLVGALGAAPQSERCVVLVSVDGLAHFYLDDPKADMPTLRRMAQEGARAEGMVGAFPTVTWPAHTSIITGCTPAKHGVIGNSYLDRQTGQAVTLLCDPVFDKDQTLRVPTVYDAAHEAGLKTASICWPATRQAKNLDWQVPDMGGDAWNQYGTRSWLDELRQAGWPVDMQGKWVTEATGGVARDWLYARMAAQVLQKHAPNLLLVHLVEPDHVQHRTGPRTADAYWCCSFADDRIRDIVEAVARSPRAAQTTVIVCGDHGFATIDRDIRPNVLLRKLGLMTVVNGKIEKQAAYCLSQGGGCAVYVLDEARRSEILAQLQRELAQVEGIEAVIPVAEFAKVGQPTPQQEPRAADLWLAAKLGYSFSGTPTGEELVAPRKSVGGTHGFLPDQPDLWSACVIWGPTVKPGTRLGKISSLDLAPTMAAILGVSLPSAEGKPLAGVGH